MNLEKVSIVIPFFNGKDYVDLMVRSIIEQSYKDWELLMVDDGSSDGAEDFVKKIAAKDCRVKYIKREDVTPVKGACAARNVGLDNAKGKYIIFFDSDDWITPKCIEQRVHFMEENNSIDFAVFPYYKYRGKDIVNGDVVSGVDTHENDLKNLIIRNLPFTVVSNIYRRDSLLRIGARWDENLASIQDADFNLTCILGGLKYKYCQTFGFDYYVRMQMNTESISKKILTPKHLESHLYYLNKNKTIVTENGQKRVLKAYALLMVSFIRLFISGSNEDFSGNLKSIIEQTFKRQPILKWRLKLLNHMSFKHGIKKGIVNAFLFPELPMAFRKSTEKRGIICKELYRQCKPTILELENIMMQ